MFIIYDLIFLVFALAYLPIFLLKKKYHRGFMQRLGFLPKSLNLGRTIWIHAVSVGEAMAVRGLLEELRKIYPEKHFVISTVTPTGNKIAKSIAAKDDFVCYLPLDLSFVVRGVIAKIKPEIFVIAETELWPNLISCLYQRQIPVVVVNSRISDKSFWRYRMIKFILRPLLNKISKFCAQSGRDAERLLGLGVNKARIEITGNMKFDLRPQKLNFDIPDLKLNKENILWVCGSTHRGEEKIILNVYKKLRDDFADLKLLIAPRHPERAQEVAWLVKKAGFSPVFISQLRVTSYELRVTRIFILDTVGQLSVFYSIADIVFVGGSLSRNGGHNILEPAVLGKPVIFGPAMFNFRDIAGLFLENRAGILVHHQKQLTETVRYLLNNPAKTVELAENAQDLIRDNQGATRRCAQIIAQQIYA